MEKIKKGAAEQSQNNQIRNSENDRQEESALEIKQKGLFHSRLGFLCEDLTGHSGNVLEAYLILLSVLEILTYAFHGWFSIAASRVWIIGGFLCAFSILGYFIMAAASDIRERKWIPVISLLLLILFLFMVTGSLNLSEVNPDATQQAAAGLNSFYKSDLNYTGKAFLGYPNRQYIIAALPALLFGRSILTLHLGFALPFILGLLILYCAFRKWADQLRINTELAVLPILALFVFPYVTEYYANFEQAIYPISFTMIAVGFFLLVLCRPNIINITGLAWTGCMLGNSYTPSLATLGLVLLFTALAAFTLLIEPRMMPWRIKAPVLTAKMLLAAEANMIIFFAATVFSNRQDRITRLRSGMNLPKLAFHSILDFLTDKNAVFFGMFGIVVIIYLLAGLTLRLKIRDFIITLWLLAVLAASNLLTGYTAYQPAWLMQRALIVIPVVVTGITLTLFEMMKKYGFHIKRLLIIIAALAFAFIGMNNFQRISQSFLYFNHVQPMKYMLADLEKSVKENGMSSKSGFNLVLYTDNIFMENLNDYLGFLYPKAKVYTLEDDEFPDTIDTGLDTYVYGDRRLSLKVPVTKKSIMKAYDQRHRMAITWYKGSIINKIR